LETETLHKVAGSHVHMHCEYGSMLETVSNVQGHLPTASLFKCFSYGCE